MKSILEEAVLHLRSMLRPSAWLPAFLLVAALAGSIASQAATIWIGPNLSFTRPDGADHTLPVNQDRLTSNVWMTRGPIQGLLNIKQETAYTHNSSPADTEWASGTTADVGSLTFNNWETWARSIGSIPSIVGVNAVLHLKTDDIYLDIKFTSWSSRSGGGFAYIRSTGPPPENHPPAVAIISPANGTALSTPVTSPSRPQPATPTPVAVSHESNSSMGQPPSVCAPTYRSASMPDSIQARMR